MLPALDARARTLLERWVYVMVRVGEDFLAPYTPAARARIRNEGGYGPAFEPFLERLLDALAEGAHTEGRWPGGSYYPGGWYRALEASGIDPARAEISPDALGPFYTDELVIEADGRWRVGPKWIEGAVLAFFLRNLRFDPDLGRYLVRYYNVTYYETRYVRHESPPFRVRGVVEEGERLVLLLNDGTREPLRSETLRLDAQERLCVAVKEHGLAARFEDNARWQLLQRLEEEGAGWLLFLGGKPIRLQLDAPRPYAGE